MCIPAHVLGREGDLTNKQVAIESLSLVTAASHIWCRNGLPMETVVLTNFHRLRKFCWKGLRMSEELNSLRDFFTSNYRSLEELELDFIDWILVGYDGPSATRSMFDEPLPSFTERILPHRSTGSIKRFASLQRLALSSFDFEEPTLQITRALNMSIFNR